MKKKGLLTLFLLSVFCTLFAQEKPTEPKGGCTVYFMPEMNGLFLSKNSVNESVQSKLGFSTGLNLNMMIGNIMVLKSGLGYGLKNVQHTQSGLTFGSNLSPQTGFSSTSKLITKLKYSEIQLPLIYQFTRKSNFVLSAGIELNAAFANQSERTIYHTNGLVEHLEKPTIPRFNFTPTVGVGYTILFSSNTSLTIEPTFKVYLKKFEFNDARLFNYGLKLTCDFSFPQKKTKTILP